MKVLRKEWSKKLRAKAAARSAQINGANAITPGLSEERIQRWPLGWHSPSRGCR
jgi:hypothetical protein